MTVSQKQVVKPNTPKERMLAADSRKPPTSDSQPKNEKAKAEKRCSAQSYDPERRDWLPKCKSPRFLDGANPKQSGLLAKLRIYASQNWQQPKSSDVAKCQN